MSESVSRDEQRLLAAQEQGRLATLGAFVRMSGPGWLQSALTLGGGSLAGSMFLGIIGGYEMLWVQLLAMMLGVIMLGAISYVTLSIESSPFKGIREHINPVLAWSWLGGALLANMVWALPQYSLAYAVLTENLFPGLVSNPDSMTAKISVSVVVLLIVSWITFRYNGEGRGVRIYEWTLKILVGLIVLSFVGVVVRLTLSGSIPWSQILVGFLPNPSHLFSPTESLQAALGGIEDQSVRDYWSDQVLATQRQQMIAAASAAVGINMTFLMPYALLAKGWNRRFRGLAVFDLATGLLLPFIFATGSIVIATASQFHAQPYSGLVIEKDGEVSIASNAPEFDQPMLNKQRDDLLKSLEIRQSKLPLEDVALSQAEVEVASMLLPRDTRELARSLENLFGNDVVARQVFGVGVVAMALSTISLLMLISGFAVCEALGVERKGWPFQLGTLCASTGVLWPLLWGGTSKAYLAIMVGTIGYTLLPIALITFQFMLNSRSLLKDAMPSPGTRAVWNVLMVIALAITGSASVWTSWHKKLHEFPIGKVLLFSFVVLVLMGHFYLQQKRKPKSE